MLSFEDAAAYLDDVADNLPQALLRDLNGGISLVPESKLNPKGKGLYILGQYVKSHSMGRYIVIYYGSFLKSFANRDDAFIRTKLREVMLHELTHHNESLAGINDLSIKDEKQIKHYNATGAFLPIDAFNDED